MVLKYPTVINNNHYALFERKNLGIALVVLYVTPGIKAFIERDEVKVLAYKLIKQSYVSKHYHIK